MDPKRFFQQLLRVVIFGFTLPITLWVVVNGLVNYYNGQPSDGKLSAENYESLILTNVIIRHGDRVPDTLLNYPTNPYANATYFPYNLGELNQKGQTRLFNVGKHLGERYRSFLGEIFYTDLVSSTASSYVRTQMSLQALHAGLFYTSKGNPVPGFPWQAVPYTVIPFADDKFISVHKRCRQFFSISTPEITDNNVQRIFDYVQLHSGFNTVTLKEIVFVSDSTQTMVENGFAVPDWLQPIYPEPLDSLKKVYWKFLQEEKKGIGAGFLLKKITEDSIAKSNGTLEPKNRKLFLYSGHDINIHVMRGALNVWTPEPVEYAAYILLELHKINGEFGYKIYYNNNYDVPQLLTIPGCKSFCPLDQFIALTRGVYDPEPTCE